MLALMVCGVMLVSLLAAFLAGRVGEWADADLDVERGGGVSEIGDAGDVPLASSSLSAADPVWRAEEPELWWDDDCWEWPECLRVEEPPGPRLILEQVI